MLDWASSPAPKVAADHTVQGSDQWLKWRGKGLGSSDAAVLLGLSPWKNITQLYEEKLGLWKPAFGPHQMKAMERGKELEPKIRAWYEAKTGSRFQESVAEHPTYPFMRASFDGRNVGLDKIIEIKAGNLKDHMAAKEGVVPSKYMPQCQWLMMVGGNQNCSYVSYGTDDTYAVIDFEADLVMQKELTERAVKFWECVQAKRPPDEREFAEWHRDLATPILIVDEVVLDAETLIKEGLALTEELKQKEARLETIKDKLKTLMGTQTNVELHGAVMGWTARKGSIDYSSIALLKSVDLESYRKPDTKSFYFKRKS